MECIEKSGLKERLCGAFLVGGLIGAVCQILIMLTSLFVPAEFSVLAAMLLFGFVGVVMICSGFYFKVMKAGYNGAAIVLSGLMFGSATGTAAAQKAGKSAGKAFLIGFWSVIKILGIGFILAVLLGMILK